MGATLVVLSISITNVALADSDGYFCTADGYLAYQLRSALTPGVSGRHVVRVVRFGDAGITASGEVELPDFQPHKLVCGVNEVTIGGWMGRPVEYTIDITGAPTVTREVSDPGRALQGSALKNLGAWAASGTVTLSATKASYRFRLVTTSREESVRGGLMHHIRTVVEQVAPDGSIAGSLEVYSGTREESVD